jgi:hypothetical protein
MGKPFISGRGKVRFPRTPLPTRVTQVQPGFDPLSEGHQEGNLHCPACTQRPTPHSTCKGGIIHSKTISEPNGSRVEYVCERCKAEL